MSFRIEIDADHSIIEVIYSGNVDFEERLKAVEEVSSIIGEYSEKRLLVDVRKIEKDMPQNDQAEFGKVLADKKELRGAKVAVVRRPGELQNLVVNTVATSRGYRIAEFESKKEAFPWLVGSVK